jgi:hypothetical protein
VTDTNWRATQTSQCPKVTGTHQCIYIYTHTHTYTHIVLLNDVKLYKYIIFYTYTEYKSQTIYMHNTSYNLNIQKMKAWDKRWMDYNFKTNSKFCIQICWSKLKMCEVHSSNFQLMDVKSLVVTK